MQHTTEEQRTEERNIPLEPDRAKPRKQFPWVWAAIGAVILLAAGYFIWHALYAGKESTDDARIEGHVVQVSSKVPGTVVEVNVKDNDSVQRGTHLVRLDTRDYEVALARVRADLAAAQSGATAAQSGIPITVTTTSGKLAGAQAGLESAKAAVATAEQGVDVARAQAQAAQARIGEAQANYERASRDLARMKQLVAKDEISRLQYDAAVAAEAGARATLESTRAAALQAERAIAVAQAQALQAEAGVGEAQANLSAAQTGPSEVAASRAQAGQASARIEQARAAVAQAELNLAYTDLIAPIAGVVSAKNVEVGQVIQSGQALLAVVPLGDIWVVAQFKETQLKQIRVGQPVEVKVDAYGGRVYHGRVDSIAAATGATFSVLPAENSSGNYVKVVQRVPVKITIDANENKDHLLRPGMSVVPTVFIK